ncbi:indolepyruvate ferredoxin oxidoreductase alpha subunit [Desulfonatronum thiosulfatophilum]|uniref:Indolepyruvate oxidoreductase subunit IorA n=1 Tax=Desulfonatronum thiosulfatophilum TaxID=617002 RepID=A0A1G6BE13_9BACT|nr:indolepyruvate ferredoxin oxidoreductase subunit alpha [Desulfonatronum thiosulfatophilum]SDB18779.1 indolepyruvate ferredoxin oxidoreductase alpha subunit [Desulfonatronum thiosulfatophilum]
MDLLLAGQTGEKHLLLGNEAIVRGALEAGINFISCYPGTPSSEVPDTFFRLSDKGSYTFEYSTNEKVALEVGIGATVAGALTLVTMKHVGVNVAADPLMSVAYFGAPGGLVLLSADDPGCHSSQNEQDNRYYARLAGLPCLEPSCAQEMKDMTKSALELSRKHEQPVMLRTSTRVNHQRGEVVFGEMREPLQVNDFVSDPRRFVIIPAVARARHKILLEKLEQYRELAENSSYNTVSGQGEVGCIASGISRAYLQDALLDLDLKDKIRVLELGFSYPLPERMIEDHLRKLSKVIIVEEGEPILETEIRALAQRLGLSLEIHGKGQHLPLFDEYSSLILKQALSAILGLPTEMAAPCPTPKQLPMRPPNMCAGCPHRSVFYSVRQVFGDDALYSSDIGCYTLGVLPPLRAADTCVCMGASISTGSGLAKVSGRTVVAYIGDSTFFHSGITGLANAVYNQRDLLVIILDNKTTAMTGQQPHPGVEHSLMGPNPARVDILGLVKACGVEHVRVQNPLNLKATKQALEELKALSGVRVLITEEPCPLFARRALGRKRPSVAAVDEGCDSCNECMDHLACPAFYVLEGKMAINESQCNGCMFCVQICEHIKPRKRS